MKQNNLALEHRKILTKAKRVVVKIGTHVLVNKNGTPNRHRIANIAHDIIQLKKNNYEVVMVTSGAIGAGLHKLGIKNRPTALYDLQMAAAVGQLQLLNAYNDIFSKSRCIISQLLLTHADLKNRTRHLNARNTILNLLSHDVIPIINENDVVADDEIKIGDNDVLSALVTELIDADLLIMLTTPDGLRKPLKKGKTQRISYLESVNKKALELVTVNKQTLSTGGMGSKLEAAQTAAKFGALVVIASGYKKNIISEVVSGKDVGTLIGNKNALSMLQKRKRWIAYFHHTKGKLVVDKGAANALIKQGKSLLPVGIKEIEGKFSIGDLLEIYSDSGGFIGKGLSEYSSDDLRKIKGKASSEIMAVLGYKNNSAAVHRNNLVVQI